MPEEHIIIHDDRFITVPKALKRIAVQNDHNIETVTFDCPRYWDNHDMSKMRIYINYMCADKSVGMYLAQNVTIDTDDTNIMHFDWTISRNATKVIGTLSFLVCIKKTDEFGYSINHWNSELNQEMYISEGLECEEPILEAYPDVISYLLTRQDLIEGQSEDYVREHIDAYFEENPLGVDATLKQTGLAADAKVVGTKFDEVSATITEKFDLAKIRIDSVAAAGSVSDNLIREDFTKADSDHNTSGTAHKDIRDTIDALRAFDVGAYSMEQVLNSETRSLFNLGNDDVPSVVLNLLGRHYWKRRKTAESVADIIVGSVGEQDFVNSTTGPVIYLYFVDYSSGSSNGDAGRYITYSSGIKVDEIGKIRLVSPTTISTTYNAANLADLTTKLQGKYAHIYGSPVDVIYIPEDAEISRYRANSDYYIYPTKYQTVENRSVDREWEYLHSDDANAYPKNTIDGEYEYVYLGRPITNAIEGNRKVAYGSYVGTGTWGYDGANTIAFDFEPKVVLVTDGNISSTDDNNTLLIPEQGVVLQETNYRLKSGLICGCYGTTVKWYYGHDSTRTSGYYATQMNTSGHTYRYIAIG